MFTIYLTFNGNYDTYLQWQMANDYDEVLREMGVVIIMTMDNEPVGGGEMTDYVAEWMVSGTKPDLEELKSTLDKTIRDFLKSKGSHDKFTLDKVKIE